MRLFSRVNKKEKKKLGYEKVIPTLFLGGLAAINYVTTSFVFLGNSNHGPAIWFTVCSGGWLVDVTEHTGGKELKGMDHLYGGIVDMFLISAQILVHAVTLSGS